MPFIGYARLGEIVEKTEAEVREDKDAGVIDLDDFESLVKYVAAYWGWGPVAGLQEEVKELKAEFEALTGKPVAAKAEPAKQLGPEDLPFQTVRWKVEDRAETHTNDPYLDRVKKRRKGGAG